MKEHIAKFPESLVDTIEACVALLENELEQGSEVAASNEPPSSLLQQCEQLISADQAQKEPIRTVHHFACTGGTLIAKCLASMPSTQLLSEVEPHSPIPQMRQSKFCPTDLIGLVRNSSRGSKSPLESLIFLGGLEPLYQDCSRKGLRLILRDHAHSKYCVGAGPSLDLSLIEVLRAKYNTRSVITVRHPLDSYLAVAQNKWLQFSPNSLDEYAARYVRFLDDMSELPYYRYEDFLKQPAEILEKICRALQISFNENWVELIGAFNLSGDSGRTSSTIGPRARRQIPEHVSAQIQSAKTYQTLCKRLDYDAT